MCCLQFASRMRRLSQRTIFAFMTRPLAGNDIELATCARARGVVFFVPLMLAAASFFAAASEASATCGDYLASLDSTQSLAAPEAPRGAERKTPCDGPNCSGRDSSRNSMTPVEIRVTRQNELAAISTPKAVFIEPLVLRIEADSALALTRFSSPPLRPPCAATSH